MFGSTQTQAQTRGKLTTSAPTHVWIEIWLYWVDSYDHDLNDMCCDPRPKITHKRCMKHTPERHDLRDLASNLRSRDKIGRVPLCDQKRLTSQRFLSLFITSTPNSDIPITALLLLPVEQGRWRSLVNRSYKHVHLIAPASVEPYKSTTWKCYNDIIILFFLLLLLGKEKNIKEVKSEYANWTPLSYIIIYIKGGPCGEYLLIFTFTPFNFSPFNRKALL